MQVKKTNLSDTEVELAIIVDLAAMTAMKDHTLTHLRSRVSVPGFRKGKVPLPIVEKHVDSAVLQTEFLEEAVGQFYSQAAQSEELRPVGQPDVSITKFVPFTDLEFTAKVEVLGPVKLGDYKKFKKPLPEAKITKADIDGVIASLRKRVAKTIDVDRPAKNGDTLWIDFIGRNAKDEPIDGGEGKDYPLELGSNTFIPGFEDNLIGAKPGDSKTFPLTFPKDYGVKALANKKVTFTVTVIKMQESQLPELDDEFAASVGPFKTVEALRADIEKELGHEKKHEARRQFESELIRDVTAKSTVAVPKALITEEIERLMREVRQNLAYRGQTFPELLEQEGLTEETYRSTILEPQAIERVSAGLVLSEIAEQEKLDVTLEELEVRMQALKAQYQDPAMRAELEKPENRRDIASRILTEKTLEKLVAYATKAENDAKA